MNDLFEVCDKRAGALPPLRASRLRCIAPDPSWCAPDEFGCEKVKTINDKYMAVSGAPDPRDDHAEALVRAHQQPWHARAAWGRAFFTLGPLVCGAV
jgi:hypothetical protein